MTLESACRTERPDYKIQIEKRGEEVWTKGAGGETDKKEGKISMEELDNVPKVKGGRWEKSRMFPWFREEDGRSRECSQG